MHGSSEKVIRTVSQHFLSFDPAAYDGVWAIMDDGCNSCSRSKAWRQNAEAKMKGFGTLLHEKATTFSGTGRSTKNGRPKIPMGILLDAVSLSWSHVPLSDNLCLCFSQCEHTFPSHFSFFPTGPRLAMDVSDTSSTLASSDPDKYDGHNIRNLMLELLCHAHIGVFMEALLGEGIRGELNFLITFALHIPCDKAEVHLLEDNPNRHHSLYSDPFV